jgi:hypothetical protein
MYIVNMGTFHDKLYHNSIFANGFMLQQQRLLGSFNSTASQELFDTDHSKQYLLFAQILRLSTLSRLTLLRGILRKARSPALLAL